MNFVREGDARPVLKVLLVGLGGFTTFSAFGNETMNLLRERDVALAAANVLANVVLALAAVWLGRSAAHLIGA